MGRTLTKYSEPQGEKAYKSGAPSSRALSSQPGSRTSSLKVEKPSQNSSQPQPSLVTKFDHLLINHTQAFTDLAINGHTRNTDVPLSATSSSPQRTTPSIVRQGSASSRSVFDRFFGIGAQLPEELPLLKGRRPIDTNVRDGSIQSFGYSSKPESKGVLNSGQDLVHIPPPRPPQDNFVSNIRMRNQKRNYNELGTSISSVSKNNPPSQIANNQQDSLFTGRRIFNSGRIVSQSSQSLRLLQHMEKSLFTRFDAFWLFHKSEEIQYACMCQPRSRKLAV